MIHKINTIEDNNRGRRGAAVQRATVNAMAVGSIPIRRNSVFSFCHFVNMTKHSIKIRQ